MFTVGHSTHTLKDFLSILEEQQIQLLINVRKLPGSKRYPHFNRDSLRPALAKAGITYLWVEQPTGRRPVSRTVPFDINAWWQNRSFHNYADHAIDKEFASALQNMCNLAAGQQLVLMCSEAV